MSGTVLVTGASGLVGSPTVRQFAADGWNVVATAHRTKVRGQPAGVNIAKVDLTDRADVDRLVSEVSPDVIAHLAAFIPPQIYRDPAMGRRVNVDATRSLVLAAEALSKPPRFVYASSGSLYGPRNPHRVTDRLTKDTPLRPTEIYGIQKLEAEELVRSSSLDWVSLRIGGVMSADPAAMPFSADTLYFGGSLAIDQQCHTVDNRDVAPGGSITRQGFSRPSGADRRETGPSHSIRCDPIRNTGPEEHPCQHPTFPQGSTSPTPTSTPSGCPPRSSPNYGAPRRSGGTRSRTVPRPSVTAATGW